MFIQKNNSHMIHAIFIVSAVAVALAIYAGTQRNKVISLQRAKREVERRYALQQIVCMYCSLVSDDELSAATETHNLLDLNMFFKGFNDEEKESMLNEAADALKHAPFPEHLVKKGHEAWGKIKTALFGDYEWTLKMQKLNA